MSRPPNVPPAFEQETVIGRAPLWRPAAPQPGADSVPTGFEETVIGHASVPLGRAAALPTGSAGPAPAHSHAQRDETGPPPDGSLVGVVLTGRYELVRLIGEGGMGLVYEAKHLAIDRRFAVKVLASELCNDRTQVERFMREARTTSKIEHENIVEISDVGAAPNGSVFFVMEFLQGEDLGAEVVNKFETTLLRV